MTRAVWLVLAASILLGFAFVSKVLDAGRIKELKATGDSLRLSVAATNVRLEAFSADSTRFAVSRDSFDLLASSLRNDLRWVRGRGRVIRASLDSARLTVQIDTLTHELRDMIVLEREAVATCHCELDLERGLRVSLEARAVVDSTELAQLNVLIAAVRDERDEAMDLVGRHEARLSFNLWRWFGDELPQLGACAGGGVVVATINQGSTLLGAGIGLAACLVKEAIF